MCSSSGISAWIFDWLEIGGLGLLSWPSAASTCNVRGDLICLIAVAFFGDGDEWQISLTDDAVDVLWE